MPKCTINGKELEVKAGTTIIEAMYENGQKIAHYCWHPGLSIAGVCRSCMVEIDGNPRVQIACNTVITEGMKVNNTSEKVKEAVKWGLDFHLINHPLDCPVCDQAGECGLQDQYMEYGKYDSEMAERKVKKRKVVDLGQHIVLDSERCILCSRCVRFTDEVSKTHELGIFNRGDRSEIGTFEDKPLNNKYEENLIDICPVGALTSKDFRFKQRVWYLKDANSICTGCSTGCNIKVYFNREGLFRVKPIHNSEINGFWMCDEGRDIFKHINLDSRLTKAKVKKVGGSFQEGQAGAVVKNIFKTMGLQGLQGASLVMTGQASSEEMDVLVSKFTGVFNSQKIYHWKNNAGHWNDFDGLLIRGDKNPNTKGLISTFTNYKLPEDGANWEQLEKDLSSGKLQTLVVAFPDLQSVYSDIREKLNLFSKAKNLIILSACKQELFEGLPNNVWIIPTKTFIEKNGTYTNFSGVEQKVKKVTTVVSEALTLSEVALLISGEEVTVEFINPFWEVNKRIDAVTYETRKKNEFTFKRGPL
jgi:NADH-quinone oxidoreductase subunit G